MQLLEENFYYRGYSYVQIWRDNDFAIYRVDLPEKDAISLEVWRIKKVDAGIVFGKQYPAREIRPTDEDFGTKAWACKDIGHAQQVVERERKKMEEQKE